MGKDKVSELSRKNRSTLIQREAEVDVKHMLKRGSNAGGSGRVGETVQDQRPLPELANIGQQLFVVPALILRHNDFL